MMRYAAAALQDYQDANAVLEMRNKIADRQEDKLCTLFIELQM